MIEKELKIRDFCGDYALDIPEFDSKGRFCKVYKAKDFKRGQRISGQNTQG